MNIGKYSKISKLYIQSVVEGKTDNFEIDRKKKFESMLRHTIIKARLLILFVFSYYSIGASLI